MKNKTIFYLGIGLIVLGSWLIFSSGADFSKLPLLDISAKMKDMELTVTDVSPEIQAKVISGFSLAIIGLLLVKIGM
ncbi:hypothetical protein [Candidatus Nitrosotenuis cloacae]|uniref:hypothetical protein n=1 Tax=Candidatus Nitrosotenuis cloacae TaxID=1603555 RepID=UPI00227E967C|nr:hypothetical protein [Candidatus Nitrosotenuis cloacae]